MTRSILPSRAGRRFASLAALALAAATTGPTSAATADGGVIALPLRPVIGDSQRTCAIKAASGVGSTVLRAGAGAKPGATDYVLINYIGYLAASGQTFDQAMATPMTVDGVIPGMSEGLLQMNKGAIHRICIPAAQGYGAAVTGPIPANSDLVFQVELVDFRTRAEVEAMNASPPAPRPAAAPSARPATPPAGK